MTVSLLGAIKNFIGHSTDAKPTDAPAGSTFYAWDTKKTFVFDGSDWQQQ